MENKIANIIKRLNRIIFKIKDYDRLEYDYCRVLDHATCSMLSYTDYNIDTICTVIDEQQEIKYREFIKEEIYNTLSHQWISIKDKLPDKTHGA